MSANITDPKFIARLTNQAIPVDLTEPIRVGEIIDRRTWQHDAVFYQSIWRDGEAIPLVLRHYRSPVTFWQTQDFHKRDREWAVLRRLRLEGFPVPRIIARGESDFGAFVIWRSPAEHRWLDSSQVSFESAKSFVPQMANLLANLHSLNHNSLNNEPLYQATVAGTLVRMLLWSREMGNESLRQVIARLKPAVAELKSWRPRLLHGNLNLGNIVTDGADITMVLNWENAAIGDPRWDVMTAADALRPIDPELGEQLVNWYETFTGHTIKDRPFWWAMISVRLWALKSWVAHAIRQGLVPPDFVDWTEDLSEVETRAFTALEQAGL